MGRPTSIASPASFSIFVREKDASVGRTACKIYLAFLTEEDNLLLSEQNEN